MFQKSSNKKFDFQLIIYENLDKKQSLAGSQ